MLRQFRFIVPLLALALAQAVPAQVPDTLPLHQIAPAAVAPSVLHAASPVSAVRAALPHSTTRLPVEMMGLAALATARKKTRRNSGKKRDVQMYVDSDLHVMRKDEDKKSVLKVIQGGVLLDDLDDDALTDDEIDEFTARRVIRPATPEEVSRLEDKGLQEERTTLATEQAQEMAALQADHATALASTPEEQKPKVQQQQETAIVKLQARHAAALNDIGA